MEIEPEVLTYEGPTMVAITELDNQLVGMVAVFCHLSAFSIVALDEQSAAVGAELHLVLSGAVIVIEAKSFAASGLPVFVIVDAGPLAAWGIRGAPVSRADSAAGAAAGWGRYVLTRSSSDERVAINPSIWPSLRQIELTCAWSSLAQVCCHLSRIPFQGLRKF